MVVAAAVVLAGIGDLIHQRERHVRCPEHGELIHADETGDRAPDDSIRATTRGHGHEHCSLIAVGRRALVPADAETELPDIGLPATDVTVSARLVAATRLWHRAPKTSPPRG